MEPFSRWVIKHVMHKVRKKLINPCEFSKFYDHKACMIHLLLFIIEYVTKDDPLYRLISMYMNIGGYKSMISPIPQCNLPHYIPAFSALLKLILIPSLGILHIQTSFYRRVTKKIKNYFKIILFF